MSNRSQAIVLSSVRSTTGVRCTSDAETPGQSGDFELLSDRFQTKNTFILVRNMDLPADQAV